MHYYDVSPTTIVRADSVSFTYTSNRELSIGAIVTIPVGKKTLVGVVLSVREKPAYPTREIITVLDQPPIPRHFVSIASWMAEHYQTHLATVWQTILPRGLTKKRRDHTASPSTKTAQNQRTKKVFTKDQRSALEQIQQMKTGTALLHGITGSGKTLVYIEAAKRCLEEGKSAIILVPEIALTSQLVSEFSAYFPKVILTHSRQTEAERHTLWLSALNDTDPAIVIGPRSALFMPLRKLGLIVIDECHEPSFKQEQSPRYSALELASQLAEQTHAKVIFGSATPSVSDYWLAKQVRNPIITMTSTARENTMSPDIAIVDMTKRSNFLKHPFLSDALLTTLQKTFANGEQAIVFHNRRGSASTTLCRHCGWSAGCPRCFLPLTLHADHHQLSCHVCAKTMPVPTICPECHQVDIVHKGIGTKRIETELKKLFPRQTIVRFDADSASDKTVDQMYEQLRDGSIDLIIGTQVIAKGLDLPHLRTVGVVQADAGLNLPDFAASERTFQLLAQVVGRVGRSHHQTNVIVQTYQPNHPAIIDGAKQNYRDFYQRTIRQRQVSNFPPFTHLLKLTCSYKTEQAAIKNCQNLAKQLEKGLPADVQILGPTPAFYERIRDSYRWQLIIKSPDRSKLVQTIKRLPSSHWQAEIDPISLI